MIGLLYCECVMRAGRAVLMSEQENEYGQTREEQLQQGQRLKSIAEKIISLSKEKNKQMSRGGQKRGNNNTGKESSKGPIEIIEISSRQSSKDSNDPNYQQQLQIVNKYINSTSPSTPTPTAKLQYQPGKLITGITTTPKRQQLQQQKRKLWQQKQYHQLQQAQQLWNRMQRPTLELQTSLNEQHRRINKSQPAELIEVSSDSSEQYNEDVDSNKRKCVYLRKQTVEKYFKRNNEQRIPVKKHTTLQYVENKDEERPVDKQMIAEGKPQFMQALKSNLTKLQRQKQHKQQKKVVKMKTVAKQIMEARMRQKQDIERARNALNKNDNLLRNIREDNIKPEIKLQNVRPVTNPKKMVMDTEQKRARSQSAKPIQPIFSSPSEQPYQILHPHFTYEQPQTQPVRRSPNSVHLQNTGPTKAKQNTKTFLTPIPSTTIHNSYYYQPTIPQNPQLSPLHRTFIARRTHPTIDLGVLSLEQLVQQSRSQHILSQELFCQFFSNYTEHLQKHFLYIFTHGQLEKWNYTRNKITPLDHRRLAEYLVHVNPKRYKIGAPLALDEEFCSFLQSMYKLSQERYRYMLEVMDKISGLTVWKSMKIKCGNNAVKIERDRDRPSKIVSMNEGRVRPIK